MKKEEIKKLIKEKNIKLYKELNTIRCSQEKTYENIAEEMNLTVSTVFSKFKKLKNGKSVKTEFLFELEKILDVKIFFEF
ncbi:MULTISPECIES: hypothetical protein [Fusobacterium]|jgi:predicted transcriptional regulator|uniref:hypothetical protein n=1 Tax=Fusobacterium TaxID=848 RepID=UPI000E878305|nr:MULTISPECIES: hypothetical protein [Fusobacterium]DAE77862.1 MAG TPA: ECF sigma factor [Caudoviricetes sp.]HBJ79746.1 hypothetical protein [Fusobacterium sp.]